ncbi:MAG: hypothetical protein HYY95_20835 [Candidatus Rokubacteria bacterium]|nr:hypothetical protein [Candidatus Rokubacteria bacterium]MBI3107982.1 hypothetical protein [Candidatus Rokubacteria bacterium]
MLESSVLSDPRFLWNAMAGYLVTLVGAVLIVAAGLWMSRAGPWALIARRPLAWQALGAAGCSLFMLGILWLLVALMRTGAVAW